MSSVIPSELDLSLLSIFAFLEGHAAISKIVPTFASEVRLQIGRRTYTGRDIVHICMLSEFEGREHVRGKHDPRQKYISLKDIRSCKKFLLQLKHIF